MITKDLANVVPLTTEAAKNRVDEREVIALAGFLFSGVLVSCLRSSPQMSLRGPTKEGRGPDWSGLRRSDSIGLPRNPSCPD